MDLLTMLEMVADAMDDRVLIGSKVSGLTGARLKEMALAGGEYVTSTSTDTVVYLGGNGVAFPVVLMSAAAARVPLLPVNYRLSDEQLTEILSRQSNALVVAEDPEGARALAPGSQVISVREFMERAARPAQSTEFEPGDPEAIALLLMTSGTTAAPKSAVLRHHHLTSYIFGSVEFAGAEPDSATLVSVPPYHIAAVANLLSNLYAGRRLVYLDRFTAADWLEIVEREQITNAMLVPTMLARIVHEMDEKGTSGPSCLQTLSYGGAKVAPSVIAAAVRMFPSTNFVNAYGLTETSSTIAVLTPEDHRIAVGSDDAKVQARLGSVGRALPEIAIEIHDPLGQALAPGVVGEVVVRGPQVAGEYLEGGSRLDPLGWFRTRDLGYMDEDGFIFVQGRADDTIIRGGENIAPAEIEEVIDRLPEVLDCAVVGIPDEEWGQRIAAFIVTRPGSELDGEQVRAYVREHLRGSKTPDVVKFLTDLPHTPTGKLLRRQLISDFADESSRV